MSKELPRVEDLVKDMPGRLYDYIDDIIAMVKANPITKPEQHKLFLLAMDDFYASSSKTFRAIDEMHVQVRRLHRMIKQSKE